MRRMRLSVYNDKGQITTTNALENVRREINILSDISHPNVIHLHEVVIVIIFMFLIFFVYVYNVGNDNICRKNQRIES